MTPDEKIAFLKEKYDQVAEILCYYKIFEDKKELDQINRQIIENQASFDKNFVLDTGVRSFTTSNFIDLYLLNEACIQSLGNCLNNIKKQIYKIQNEELNKKLGF